MNKAKLVDFVERVGTTFFVAFAGVAMGTGLSDHKSLEAAAIAGGMSALKFLVVEANGYLKAQ